MPDDENVIETDVVLIKPDATGFRRSLNAQLKKEMTPAPKAVIALAVDGKGLRNKVREAVAAQQALRGQPTYKVALVADRTGFAQSVRDELKKVRQLEYKVKLVADGSGLRGARGAADDRGAADREARRAEREALKAEREANKIYKRLREAWEVVEQDELRAYAHLFSRFRDHTERMQAAELAAYREEARRNKEAADRESALSTQAEREAAARAQRRYQRVRSTQEQIEHAHAQAEREMTAATLREESKRAAAFQQTRRALNTYRKGPQIIDWGGRGIRPMNLLLGTVTALSPALFAMSANAVQASTAVAALGSAGVGAALGIGGLITAFNGLGDVLSLRQQVKDQALTDAANASVDRLSNRNQLADSMADYRTALREERRAEEAIHTARREAARDLEDLRRKVINLNNEYRSNQLSVREAEEAERATNRNFFATATERLRARQNTLDARNQLGDTRLERRQAQEDLRESIRKGVTNADKVIKAQDAYVDAKRRRQQAGRQLQNLRSGADAAATGKVTSAAAQLEQKLKDMAPAARDIYYWFVRNEETLKRMQRGIAQAVLPGFYKFLQAIERKPGGGKSTMQLFADAMGELGGIAGDVAARIGRLTNTSLFRKGFDKIQRNNAEAFRILGDAAVTFMRPLTRILAAASPLFPKMARGLASLVDRFDAFIARTAKDGSLGKWFEDAYESGRKWMSIGGNILRFLKQIFQISLPTGASLVDQLVTFTDKIADWAESTNGQRQIREFFQTFRDLPYGQIRDFFLQGIQLFAAWRATQWAKANPFFAAVGLLAASNPTQFITVMTGVTKLVNGIAGVITAHPEIAAILLGLFSANRGLKALGLTVAIPGLAKIKDLLTSKFKFLDKAFGGGATTGTMTVQAGVVNVYGKTIGAGGPAAGGAAGGRLTNSAAVGTGAITAALIGYEFAQRGYARGAAGKGPFSAFEEFRRNPNPDTLIGAMEPASFVGLVATAWGAASTPEGKKLVTTLNNLAGTLGPLPGLFDRFFNQGKEDYAFRQLRGDITEYGKNPGAANNPAVVNRAAVRDYIAARKAAVDAAVETARATRGEAAAERVREYETRRSVDTLREMLRQYGWNEQKADAYSRAIYGLNEINEKQRLSSLRARDAMEQMRVKLGEAGKKASTTRAEIEILSSKLNELDGTRTITVTIDGNATVFRNLETALIYQQLLKSGEPATQGNIAERRAAFRKQERTANLADGGKVRGFSPNSRADNIPAWLTANEYVQPVDAVKHYGVGFMDAIRRKQLPRFADGGQVWPYKVAWPKGMDTAVQPEVTYGPGQLPEYTGRIPGGLGAVAGLSARMMAAVIDANKRFPWARVISGLRPGAITVTGRKSNHGFGRATDWPASMQLFEYFRAKYMRQIRELIFSPAGGRQVWNGRPHFYSGKVRDTHWDHVHLALNQGGPVVRPKKFDTGGVLPPGFTLAYNGTGKNETIRTARQEQALADARVDSRDIARLAAALASNNITMDGRKVAEVTNKYNYVPAGV